jgi:hypothetical protein
MQIAIKGPGDTIICFIDRNGRTLLQETFSIFGSPSIKLTRSIDLALKTNAGVVEAAPVLVRCVDGEQVVTFDGYEPSAFTIKRCQQIGCSQDIAEEAARGYARQLQADVSRIA